MLPGSPPLARHRTTHPTYVEGCNPCKWASLYFAPVPGGHWESSTTLGALRQNDRNMQRYRDKRQAGEQPGGTTKHAMDKSEKLEDIWEGHEKILEKDNPPEAVAKVKKSLTNT